MAGRLLTTRNSSFDVRSRFLHILGMEAHNGFTGRHLEKAETAINEALAVAREEVRALGERIAEDEASLADFEARVAPGKAREIETAQAIAEDLKDHPTFANVELFKSRAVVIKNYDEGMTKDIQAIRAKIEDMKAQQRVWEATLGAIENSATGEMKKAA